MTKGSFNTKKIKDHLVAKILSPGKLYVYWQLLDDKIRFVSHYFNLEDEQPGLILRLYDRTSNKLLQEVFIRPEVKSWLFKGIKPDCNFLVELGMYRAGNQFFPLLRSNPIMQNPGSAHIASGPQGVPGWVGKVSTYTYYEDLEGSSRK
ncbi:DUF4912 domain-containing protein [Mesobacillus subterraneus]|uniref:DUF4912 domain-containing protein n=1 Tax=Mesobacillus subterraneus TaxID=285983 RepID=UPI001474591C|nr:DUF4912 domain-containing protein [Mesobacillus subterraneus]